MRNRHIGKFSVSHLFLDEGNACLHRLMEKIIVLRADYVPWNNAFEYVAICGEFEECPLGEEPPVYDVICSGDPIAVSFQRRPY